MFSTIDEVDNALHQLYVGRDYVLGCLPADHKFQPDRVIHGPRAGSAWSIQEGRYIGGHSLQGLIRQVEAGLVHLPRIVGYFTPDESPSSPRRNAAWVVARPNYPINTTSTDGYKFLYDLKWLSVAFKVFDDVDWRLARFYEDSFDRTNVSSGLLGSSLSDIQDMLRGWMKPCVVTTARYNLFEEMPYSGVNTVTGAKESGHFMLLTSDFRESCNLFIEM